MNGFLKSATFIKSEMFIKLFALTRWNKHELAPGLSGTFSFYQLCGGVIMVNIGNDSSSLTLPTHSPPSPNTSLKSGISLWSEGHFQPLSPFASDILCWFFLL